MTDYSKSIIYNVYYNEELLYIGSTIDFKRRKYEHKRKVKTNNCNLYKYLNEKKIDWNSLEWILTEYSFETKNELIQKEGELVRLYKPLCNSDIPGRTKEEWTEENKEKTRLNQIIYRKENADYIKQKKKEYAEKNSVIISEKCKKKYEENKEKILQKNKIWRDNNQEKFKAKITCECGSIVAMQGIDKHKKTTKHIKYLENKT